MSELLMALEAGIRPLIKDREDKAFQRGVDRGRFEKTSECIKESRASFNQLTPAETERLALLSEELGEAQQVIGKILRHGYRSTHPDRNIPNRSELMNEVGDVLAAVFLMVNADDMNMKYIEKQREIKLDRVKEYLHHQG